jgi:peptide-methionine (S)-S-oxide reductase
MRVQRNVFMAAVLAAFFSTAYAQEAGLEKATFAAGCFWGVEKVFAALPGVKSTQVGYTGGKKDHPSYEEVCGGRTGHAEAIEITFDPAEIRYDELIETFFRHHDPTTKDRQGNDIGSQYRSAVFYHSPAQKSAAEKAIRALDEAKIFRGPVVTSLEEAATFWRAEEYHQKYLKKNPMGYCALQTQPAKVGEVLRKSRAS